MLASIDDESLGLASFYSNVKGVQQPISLYQAKAR